METVYQHSVYVECARVLPVCHTCFVSHTRLHTNFHHSILCTAVRHPHQTCPKFKVYISVLQICYLTLHPESEESLGIQHKLVTKLGLFIYCKVGRIVGIKTGYGLDGPGIESRWRRDFPHTSRPALGLTQPPIQWVPGHSRVKAVGAWLWPPTKSSAEVKERVELYLYSPSGSSWPVLYHIR
jgi:hypothetical protein